MSFLVAGMGENSGSPSSGAGANACKGKEGRVKKPKFYTFGTKNQALKFINQKPIKQCEQVKVTKLHLLDGAELIFSDFGQ